MFVTLLLVSTLQTCLLEGGDMVMNAHLFKKPDWPEF